MNTFIVNFVLFLWAMPKRSVRLGMALVKLGGGVADMRGSIGGTTFSRNRYGAIARNRTVPVNPATAAQTKIRSIMSVARHAWQAILTVDQRSAWATYAAAVEMKNRLGESIKLTGWNHFARSACALLYNDYDIVADGPTVLALPEQDETLTLTGSVGTQKVSVAFDEAGDWVEENDAALLVYVSRGQSPTVNSFKGPYLLAGAVEGASATPPESPAAIDSPFALTAGQKVFVQCRIVRADGRLSEPFRSVCVVGV